jgi:hypothetical protein
LQSILDMLDAIDRADQVVDAVTRYHAWRMRFRLEFGFFP